MKNKVNFTGGTSKGIKIMKFRALVLTILVSISVLTSTATAAMHNGLALNGLALNGLALNHLSLNALTFNALTFNGRSLHYNVDSATQGLDFSTIGQQALKK